MIVLFGLLCCLGVLSGVLSSAETSLTAASRIRLHQLSQDGDPRAKVVLGLQEKMSQVIATLLLANTIVITFLTTLSTMLFTQWLGEEMGVIYATLSMSAFITIYLEVLPKVFVFSRAEGVAMALSGFVSRLVFILSPIIRLVDSLANLSLRVVGVSLNKPSSSTSSLEELKGAIELYRPSAGRSNERLMLKNILDLTRVTVASVMTHRKKMFSLDKNMPAQKLVAKVLASPFSRIPIWQDTPESIIGLLHIKELSRALEKTKAQDLDITTLLTPPWFIPETTTLLNQLQAFKERREHFAFVVDEYGTLVGLVTLEDILEEIVGDIQDEHDIPLSGVTPLSPRSFLVDGTVALRDLSRNYRWTFPSSKATTLAGLILEHAGRIPNSKQTFQVGTYQVEVVKKAHNQIQLLKVTLPDASPSTATPEDNVDKT